MDTINHFENQGEQFKSHEVLMAKSAALDTLNLDESKLQEEKLIGEGFYRLAKVYYDKADFVRAEDFFLKALSKTIYPRDAFAMFKCYGFLIRIYSEEMRADKAD
ncbi:MAG: hypothetical protein HON90_03095, partial [Halobacteriovoraceae bacterium]|nr:hypothetical protein [Halobacteriovoraceae bacterium]